jgi:hypothetical protein
MDGFIKQDSSRNRDFPVFHPNIQQMESFYLFIEENYDIMLPYGDVRLFRPVLYFLIITKN